MFWLSPLAWFGLAAIAVPIVVHLLAHRRAERIAFPTLRFLQPTRLAAMHRRALDDLALLVIRCAIVVAAVAAFAGPLLITPARRAAWESRLLSQTVDTPPLSEGIHRAVARLAAAPPGRRELVIAAPLTIGSLTAAHLTQIPPHVGIRFVRTGRPAASRSIEVPPLMATAGELRRTAVLTGAETVVREEPTTGAASWPIDIVASPQLQRTVDAARAAVLALRIPVPRTDRRAQLALVDSTESPTSLARRSRDAAEAAGPTSIATPWIADAAARIARDADLQAESARTPAGLADPPFTAAPWLVLTTAADGKPAAVAAASGGRLLAVARASDGDLIVPTLVRAMAGALADSIDLTAADVLPIPDAQLRAWTRAPGPPPPPRPETVERDDRRWLWGAVLLLLAIETWMRRQTADVRHATEETRARVA